MSWLVHTKQLTEDQSNILTYIQIGYKHKQTKEGNKMTKVHITETGPMYRLSDMYNHKGFTHWNKNKKYTGESMSNSNSLGNGYKIYDLIDEQGFIYYEIYKIGLSKDKKELDNTNDVLILTTYDNKQVNKYMNESQAA